MFGVFGMWVLFENNYILESLEIFNPRNQHENDYVYMLQNARTRCISYKKRAQLFVAICWLYG